MHVHACVYFKQRELRTLITYKVTETRGPFAALQLQSDVRKDMNQEKKEAQGELEAKRLKAEKRAQGKGKGRGRGRGRRTANTDEERVAGKAEDEAAEHIPEEALQKLRSKRENGSDDENNESDAEAISF